MSGLAIVNETVYVIYRGGKPYQEDGRKIVYTKPGPANGVITAATKREAEDRYESKRAERDSGILTMPEWYYLSRREMQRLIDQVRKEFSIVEYGPK